MLRVRAGKEKWRKLHCKITRVPLSFSKQNYLLLPSAEHSCNVHKIVWLIVQEETRSLMAAKSTLSSIILPFTSLQTDSWIVWYHENIWRREGGSAQEFYDFFNSWNFHKVKRTDIKLIKARNYRTKAKTFSSNFQIFAHNFIHSTAHLPPLSIVIYISASLTQ